VAVQPATRPATQPAVQPAVGEHATQSTHSTP
jgi:hypothetical protein